LVKLLLQSTRIYLYSDVDKPAEEENAEVERVDNSQCGQVDTARHVTQISAGKDEE